MCEVTMKKDTGNDNYEKRLKRFDRKFSELRRLEPKDKYLYELMDECRFRISKYTWI